MSRRKLKKRFVDFRFPFNTDTYSGKIAGDTLEGFQQEVGLIFGRTESPRPHGRQLLRTRLGINDELPYLFLQYKRRKMNLSTTTPLTTYFAEKGVSLIFDSRSRCLGSPTKLLSEGEDAREPERQPRPDPGKTRKVRRP